MNPLFKLSQEEIKKMRETEISVTYSDEGMADTIRGYVKIIKKIR